jgi:hypothetical protein
MPPATEGPALALALALRAVQCKAFFGLHPTLRGKKAEGVRRPMVLRLLMPTAPLRGVTLALLPYASGNRRGKGSKALGEECRPFGCLAPAEQVHA